MAVKQIVLFKYQSLVQLSNFSSPHFFFFFFLNIQLFSFGKAKLCLLSLTQTVKDKHVYPGGFLYFLMEKMPESVF